MLLLDTLLRPLCCWERRGNKDGAGPFILPKCSGTALSLLPLASGTNLLTDFPGRDQWGWLDALRRMWAPSFCCRSVRGHWCSHIR